MRYTLALLAGLCAVALVLFGATTGAAPAPRPAPAAPLAPAAENLPPGAVIDTIIPDAGNAVAMAWDPDGRLFFTQKSTSTPNTGAVRLFANNVLQASPVITFNVDTCSERGLLGIALDPDFSTNHYIYVYYTAYSNCGATENRVARFVETNGVGSSPTTIFTSLQTAPNHNGGNIHFGPDGKLYISIGDNANAANAQDVTAKNGKMHRINSDGTFPVDNPVFTQTNALPSLFAMGLRNSFDFTFDPLSPNIYASENGPGCDDEANRIVAGYNYGWRAGYPCDDANPDPTYNTIPPLWYIGNGCCVAPTGIEVYRGNAVPTWHNDLFMCAYNYSYLYHFYLSGDRNQIVNAQTVNGVSCNMDISTGPDGAFYYFQGGGYSMASLKRISGAPPPATATPTATATPAPPTVTVTPAPPTATAAPPTATATAALPTATVTGTPPTATPSPTPAPPCTIEFSDVPPGSPFYSYIRCLACRGVLSGYADNTFRPGNTLTRGQAAKILANAAGYTDTIPPARQSFVDVPPAQPFWEWIERAYAHGVISGYTCGGPGEPCDGTGRTYFRPNADITRGQLSKIVAFAAGYTGTPTTQRFEDVPPGHPFYGPIEQMAARDIISGYTCGAPPAGPCVPPANRPYFLSANPVTRGQAAKILANTFFPNCQTPAR
jgi:glucose/arabinose dehydrogenase